MGPIIHNPGDCVDPLYGNPWCNGIGEWGPNPFNEEIYGDSTPVWMCAGARVGAAQDI